ncbi:MAG: molybdopterin molybdenumtransferase MoeA [Deltaproteobacteria bacterium]|nr:MAG: molybdopterin molybdenumtransferase MoeA [Deltaproteobacteria bacterium]
MENFFQLKSSAEVLTHLKAFSPLETERQTLKKARGRILAADIHSPEELPPFSRSTMDGFAVRARDVFGCSESEPALLKIIGELQMGESAEKYSLEPGQAVQIWTGGEIPAKADAVVMVEYTKHLSEKEIAVYRPVAPGENVIAAGEDYRQGEIVLAAGSRLRPQELGVLSGLGITEVSVYRRPKVAILSTGDELVAATEKPAAGKIRDINSTTLEVLVEEAGALPHCHGICGDDYDTLLASAQQAGEEADILLLSGGSSVGRRDFTLRVFESLQNTETLVHGISVRPGKPTILVKQGNKALIGLPGHVASAMVIFYLFVRPLIRRYSGLETTHGLRSVHGITLEPVPSAIGREEYVRVHLQDIGETIPGIRPVYGRSGLLSPLVKADGLLPIGRDVEGLDKGSPARVLLFP